MDVERRSSGVAMYQQTSALSPTEKHNTAAGGKIRILFVSGFVADTYSEIERQYVELCSAVGSNVEFVWLVPSISCKYNRFARRDFKATLTEPVWAGHLRANKIPYVIGNISKYNVIANVLLFREIFRKYRIDAVYTHFGFERFWAALLGRLWGKVIIWNEHWHSLGTRYILPKRVFYRLFVDEFIAVSQFIAQTLPGFRKVHVIRNAIHADSQPGASLERKSAFRRALGIPDESKVVLMVSAFRPNKHHDLALEACEKVLKKRDDVAFVFLGEGTTRPWFTEKVKELKLQARILMPGHVDNVEDYYSIADLCMLTSIGEPCALAIVEAMSHAKPLIAFRSGGTPEVINDEETGLLIDEADVQQFSEAVLRLVDDDAERMRMGGNALRVVRKQADRNTWAKQLNGLLKDIVDRNVISEPE